MKAGMKPLKIFVGCVIAAVVAAVVGGLYLAGSPGKERMRQFDNQRVAELQQISYAVDSYFVSESALPLTLESLTAAPVGGKPWSLYGNVVDPETGVPYEYRAIDAANYELCAVFSQPSSEEQQPYMAPRPAMPMGVGLPESWEHPGGRYCFTLNAEQRTAQKACSITSPCQAGQNCVTLPNREGAYCVPAGKECLAAGCSSSCVIAESYPAQVRCTTPEPEPVSQLQ